MMSPNLYGMHATRPITHDAVQRDVLFDSNKPALENTAAEKASVLDHICCCFRPLPRYVRQDALIVPTSDPIVDPNGGPNALNVASKKSLKLNCLEACCPPKKTRQVDPKRLSTITEEGSDVFLCDSDLESAHQDRYSLQVDRRYTIFQDPLSSLSFDSVDSFKLQD